jgi:mono/diheme cytochrome c family protein
MGLIGRRFRRRRHWLLPAAAACWISGCVQRQPASDTGDPGFPFGPSAVGVQTIAYVQDIKPIFDRDCASCHGVRESAGNYSVRTYADVMAGQRPGDASSSVVVDCSPGGSMYRYFSGDRVTEATLVFRWMVYYNAVQSR